MDNDTQYANIVNAITMYYNEPIELNNMHDYSEKHIMQILFTNEFAATPKFVQYILQPGLDYTYISINSNKRFYDRDMNRLTVSELSSATKNVIDVDVSYFNSQHIIKYLFLLDLLSEIYANFRHTTKITVKCRYEIDNGQWILYKRNDYYQVDIQFWYNKHLDNATFEVYDIKLQGSALMNKDRMMQNFNDMCNLFKEDIEQHIKYLHQKDVQMANSENAYLFNIQSFYKFCRLKLVYYTLLCMPNGDVDSRFTQDTPQYFIDRQLPFCFINLKNQILVKNPNQNNMIATNKLIVKRKKLQNINDITQKAKYAIKHNYKSAAKIGNFNKQMFYICLVVTFITIITTILMLNIGLTESSEYKVITVIMLITLSIYITLHYILYINNLDTFESQLDAILKFPIESAPSNDYVYKFRYPIKRIQISGSSISSTELHNYWHAFDDDPSTYWESGIGTFMNKNAKNTSFGEFLIIDLNENVKLKNYVIKFKEGNANNAPANFKIYARESFPALSAIPSLTDPNWKLLQETKNVTYEINQKRFQLAFNKYLYPSQIAAGKRFSIVCKNKEVYAFGLNSYGQLGNTTTIKSFNPEKVFGGANFLRNVLQVAAGGYHTLFLLDTGYVFGCGDNQFGQLGRGQASSEKISSQAVNVLTGPETPLKNIIQVCAGHVHSLFLKSNRFVIGCGQNLNGQLGDNTTETKFYASTYVTEENTRLSNIVQISAGSYSFGTFFLRNNGVVYRCGIYKDYLNEEQYGSSIVAIQIPIDDITVKIASSGGFCLALTKSNKVWGIGYNTYNQIGINQIGISEKERILVKNPIYCNIPASIQIIDIAAGAQHSLFLTSSRNVFGCGRNQFGQLGINSANDITSLENINIAYVKYQNTNIQNVVQISAGENHSLFLLKDGKVLACGLNGDGAVGIGNDDVTYDVTTQGYTECTRCIESKAENSKFFKLIPQQVMLANGVQFVGDSFPNIDNKSLTLIDNFQNEIWYNNVGKAYRYYALVINRLVGNVDKAQIGSWELYGTYEQQLNVLQTSYNNYYNEMIKPLENKVDQAKETLRIATSNLNDAIKAEESAYDRAQKLLQDIREIKINDNIIAINPDNLSIEFLQNHLPLIQDNITSNQAAIILINNNITSSNTYAATLHRDAATLDTQNGELDTKISTFSGYKIKFDGYYADIATLSSALQATISKNNGIIDEHDAAKLIAEKKNLDAGIRLDSAQLAQLTSETLLLNENIQYTENGSILAQITLKTMDYVRKTTNETNAISAIQKQIANISSLDAELLQREKDKLASQSLLASQKAITDGAQIVADGQMDLVKSTQNLVTELQSSLASMKSDNNLRLKTGRLLQSDIERLNNEISDIENDRLYYVNKYEKDARLAAAKAERQQKYLQAEITGLESTLNNLTTDVEDILKQYQQKITDDMNDKEAYERKITEVSSDIVNFFIEKQRYKFIAKAISVEASVINIQTKILYNINETATIIANSIILSGMEKEYNKLKQNEDNVKLLEDKSEHHIDIALRDDKLLLASNKFILNLLLIVTLFVIFYSKYISSIILVILIIIMIIMITFYIIDCIQIVRTVNNQYYWKTPNVDIE